LTLCSRPQKASDLNEAMQIALIFLVPFLLQLRVLSQGAIVRHVLLLIRFNHFVHLGIRDLLELERRNSQFLVVERASPCGSLVFPPLVQAVDLAPDLFVQFVRVPIDVLAWLFMLDEINQQLEGGVKKDLILIVPPGIQ